MIDVKDYADAIHLFEPWKPPADNKKEPLSALLADAIHELEKSVKIENYEKYKALLKNKKSLLREIISHWNPEPNTKAYDKVMRALHRGYYPRRMIKPDSPAFLFYTNYLTRDQICADALAENLFSDATVPAHIKRAGPQVQLDMQTICGCIGRELQTCEAVAVRGYCFASKYLVLSVPFQWEKGCHSTKIEQYYANIFDVVRKLGCSNILLSSLFSDRPDQPLANFEFEILVRELKQNPKLKHMLIRTEKERIQGYNKLIEHLWMDGEAAEEDSGEH